MKLVIMVYSLVEWTEAKMFLFELRRQSSPPMSEHTDWGYKGKMDSSFFFVDVERKHQEERWGVKEKSVLGNAEEQNWFKLRLSPVAGEKGSHPASKKIGPCGKMMHRGQSRKIKNKEATGLRRMMFYGSFEVFGNKTDQPIGSVLLRDIHSTRPPSN